MFKRIAIFTIGSLTLLTLEAFGQPRMSRLSFYSTSVSDTMHVVVLLPVGYNTSRSYPVLYLLHGYGGDETDWTTKTDLVSYTAGLPLIVVMPEAKNSWYVNSVADPRAKYEDYIIDELPRFIESHFRIDTTREAIAGLSMGGYGALMLGLRHPHKFLFIGDLSGAITIPQIIDSVLTVPGFKVGRAQEPIIQSIYDAFGRNDKPFRDAHNVFDLLAKDRAREVPYIFMAAGIQDGYKEFLPADHQFIDSLHAHNVLYEYRELPGQHDWKFWNEEVKPMLERMRTIMHLVGQ